MGIRPLEFLSDSDVAAAGDIVDSGICSDAHGDEPGILAIAELIRRQHASSKRILDRCLLNFCGHELLIQSEVGSQR